MNFVFLKAQGILSMAQVQTESNLHVRAEKCVRKHFSPDTTVVQITYLFPFTVNLNKDVICHNSEPPKA